MWACNEIQMKEARPGNLDRSRLFCFSWASQPWIHFINNNIIFVTTCSLLAAWIPTASADPAATLLRSGALTFCCSSLCCTVLLWLASLAGQGSCSLILNAGLNEGRGSLCLYALADCSSGCATGGSPAVLAVQPCKQKHKNYTVSNSCLNCILNFNRRCSLSLSLHLLFNLVLHLEPTRHLLSSYSHLLSAVGLNLTQKSDTVRVVEVAHHFLS